MILKFWEDDYNVAEENGVVTIGMTIGETQIPFTLRLTPTTVDDVLVDTRLIATDYLREAYSTLSEAGKATPGETQLGLLVNMSSKERKITYQGQEWPRLNCRWI